MKGGKIKMYAEDDIPQISEEEKNHEYIKMDFSLKTSQERIAKVKEILAATPPEKLTSYYLNKLADYIVLPITKEEKKKKYILTNNHLKNINEREMSFEGLVSKLENGEDGIYNMIANDKNIIFNNNKKYTEEEIKNIPGLKEYMEDIDKVNNNFKQSTGKKKMLLKKQLIEMHKDKYELGKSYKQPIRSMNLIKSMPKLDLVEKIYVTPEGNVQSTGIINLFNPKHISILLCNYSKIKEDCWDKFNSDIKWLMEDLDNLVELTLRDKYPYYYDLLIYKIDGLPNNEIQLLLEKKHGILHTVEYISSLWRNKIPKMIARTAEDEWLNWYYTEKKRGKWKRCSKCGQIKLAHNHFFSKNNTSKDHFYSICKECRNKK